MEELSPFLELAIESISSKNIIEGAADLALLNISLIAFSEPPTNLSSNFITMFY